MPLWLLFRTIDRTLHVSLHTFQSCGTPTVKSKRCTIKSKSTQKLKSAYKGFLKSNKKVDCNHYNSFRKPTKNGELKWFQFFQIANKKSGLNLIQCFQMVNIMWLNESFLMLWATGPQEADKFCDVLVQRTVLVLLCHCLLWGWSKLPVSLLISDIKVFVMSL